MFGVKSFLVDGDGVLVKGNVWYLIVEDDVVIYVGVMIFGCVMIGCGVVIGGNVWFMYSVLFGMSVV